MAINLQLRDEIAKQTSLSKSRIYAKINEYGKDLLVSKEIAAYYYAKSIGIDIRQYVQDTSILDEIRNLPALSPTAKPILKPYIEKPKKNLSNATIPFISTEDINKCIVNSEMYSRFYYFENAIRKIIIKIMEKEFGLNWWNIYIKKNISSIDSNVASRKADEQNTPWHSGRGVHNIYYTDLDDLRQIIENNYNKLFSISFNGKKNLKIFIGWILEIEHSRNILAHNNPLSKKDSKRIIQITNDFSEFSKKIKI